MSIVTMSLSPSTFHSTLCIRRLPQWMFAGRYMFRQTSRSIKCRSSYGLVEPQAERRGHYTRGLFTGTILLTSRPFWRRALSDRYENRGDDDLWSV
jgi:hypothetical protein